MVNKDLADGEQEHPLSIVMMGASGAVGTEVVRTLGGYASLEQLTLLNRRSLDALLDTRIRQLTIDVLDPKSYAAALPGHKIAICTLGVGQPSKVSKEQYLRIDKEAVLDFAAQCKMAGVGHFELLCSIGANTDSRSFYLRAKGELQEELAALKFDRLSLFQPSMILTEHNRYGVGQALTLAVWPKLDTVLVGPLRKLRGIPVETLGRAMAKNTRTIASGLEILQWDEIMRLAGEKT